MQSSFCLVAGLAALLGAPCDHQGGPKSEIKVTVISIVATDRGKEIDPRVKCIADEVRKSEPTLTGFKLARTSCKSVTIGKKEAFKLIDEEKATITIDQGEDKDGMIGLTVKAPQLGDITYLSACGKFFPIMTRYQTKDKEHLIIAVMVTPCMGKKK